MNRIIECGMLIKQISDSIAQMSNNELRKSGLTLSQLRYLEYLSESQNEPTPFKELEAHFMVSQPTVVGVIKRLERKGLVAVLQSKSGGNVKTAVLTEQGKALYNASQAHKSEVEKRLISPLDSNEQAQFEDMLRRVRDHMEEV